MSKEMSPERVMLVGSALQGLLAGKYAGPSYHPSNIKYYSENAIALADATMEKMATEVVPNVPEMIVEEKVIVKK